MQRLRSSILLMVCGLAAAAPAWAQYYDQPAPVPLGDVARALRKPAPATPAPQATPKTVIDNDNFSQVMDQVESRKQARTSTLFSFEADSKTFRMTATPDVTCSLSFSANMTSLISDPYMARELPESERAKLDGPAVIDGDSLQVSVFNGTSWRVDEITVGLTIVRKAPTAAGYYGNAKLVPASSATSEIAQKPADLTTLYKMRAAAAPAAVTVFRAPLTQAPNPDEEWHWAIVQAKGIPPRPLATPETDSAVAVTPAVAPASQNGATTAPASPNTPSSFASPAAAPTSPNN